MDAPYKRIDPAVSIILGAVTDFYNGKLVYTPFKMQKVKETKNTKKNTLQKVASIKGHRQNGNNS